MIAAVALLRREKTVPVSQLSSEGGFRSARVRRHRSGRREGFIYEIENRGGGIEHGRRVVVVLRLFLGGHG